MSFTPAFILLAIAWSHCPPDPLFWFQLREPLLQLLYQPWLLLPLIGWFTWRLSAPLPALGRSAAVLLPLLCVALLYSPLGTAGLTAWLQRQLPPSPDSTTSQQSPGVVVLLGRGAKVAQATTALAAAVVHRGVASAVYVSGDAISTARVLERQGVPSVRIAGDSCARTTWENATRSADWLRHHHPNSQALLITDPWQLPRATAAFRRQGLVVQPIPADPELNSIERNRLALRETAGSLLYKLQGRF